MAKKLTYLDFAEQAYDSIIRAYEYGITGNVTCADAQKTCEWYLKYLLDVYVSDQSSYVMKSHSLRALGNCLGMYLPDFECDWTVVLKADGFYFTATYPGDDAFFAGDSETKECIEALKHVRECVLAYIDVHKPKNNVSAEEALDAILDADSQADLDAFDKA